MSRLSQNIGRRILSRSFRRQTRNKSVQNFNTAKNVVIVFDALIPGSFPVIKDFTRYLSEKSIKNSVIGFVAAREVPQEMLLWANFDFITKKELSWYGKPAGAIADSFFSAEPDILFVFSFTPSLSMDYLSQLSAAKFKVGCFTEASNDYDLMINPPGGSCELPYFIEQVKHYILMLNPS